MNAKEQSILLVDDEVDFRKRLGKAFARRGYKVYEADGYESALALIRQENPAQAVIDLRMPGKSGLELVAAAARLPEPPAMVVLTGYGSIATATEAIRLGALSYLPKPADVDDIIQAFNHDPQREPEPAAEDFAAPSLARAEWEHINRVLNDCQGNISQAAQRLGLHRRTLQRKLQKYPPKA
ncbi:response regulator transcription factor [Desulfurivibrio alkaliphilus]|uniref:Two component transcriptional regulator, Fis family n=1 Tax=Desulfurivibrio alkaliphilus (strain DSM 19089 / UNIQEM U267 / AHT2) TaxID=589865 RepID=D6Z3T8_DESAT|nr:response regulator [Desulfurivibrio alkaliphilus]ADH86213.1 two component transcriptional regulator, Fis family [Desulfurivibrio alkaliphilus AHT 2]